MNPLEYLHLQMRLEGKEIVHECYMRQVEAVPGEELPLMLVAQLANGALAVRYDEAISPDLQRELDASHIEFPKMESLIGILQKHKLLFGIGHFKTYIVPYLPAMETDIQCFPKDEPKVKVFGFDGFAEQVYAVERDGKVVSACVSTRENERCGEAWVYTDPKYRGQGFAQKVVRAWAKGLMEADKLPFYSHRIENLASASLARKLGLQPVFEEIAISQA